MDIRKRLFSNMFLRNMIADIFGRTNAQKPGGFTPYFQYKIGPYHSDYYLYFPKEPYPVRYKNEIFNKLNEYYDADIADYLAFHYKAYPDKQAFLKFLRYELYGRLNRSLNEERRHRLLFVQEWVSEKQGEVQLDVEASLKQEIEQGVRDVLPVAGTDSPIYIENLTSILSEKLTDRIEKIISATEERMLSLTDSFVTANIELNNQNHLDKVVKLFKLLKDVQAPKDYAKAEQLFKRFSDTDIAAILRLHFKDFKNKQLNTIQGNIKKADESIPDKHPKVKKLEEALAEYFYS